MLIYGYDNFRFMASNVDPVEVIIRPKPPYSISLHFRRFSLKGRPVPYFYEKNTYRRLVRVGGEVVPIEVEIVSEGMEPMLKVKVWENKEKTVEVVRHIFNIDLDLSNIRFNDDFLDMLVNKYLGLRPPKSPTLFEALVKSIINQQINLRLALTMTANLVEKYGYREIYGGRMFYDFPTPEKLAEVSVNELRKCGLSRRKCEYVISLAKMVCSGFNLEGIKYLKPEEAIEVLDNIRGVGVWTAELAYVMATGDLSVGPAGDLAVVKGLSRALGKRVEEGEVRDFVSKYRDVAGLIMYYLAFYWEEYSLSGK